MKIAYVFDDSLDRPDGVQQAVITTGEWMRSQGHDVHYLVGHTERDDLENIHSLARSLRVKFNGNTLGTPLPTSSKQIRKFLAMHKFDVLHVQMPYSPFFAEKVILAAPQDIKIIGTFHILPYSKFGSIATKHLGRVLRRSLKRFHYFVSVSRPAHDFAKATFGIDSSVIPNPVDTSRFVGAKRTAGRSKKRIIFLGRLEERKGIIELVRAYRRLIEDKPELAAKTELYIGGKGPLKDRVHKDIQKMPRSATVKLLGFVPEDEKAELLASADVAVFPSLSGESFGIVLVEAMAAGSRMVLAGNNPGYSSVLEDKPELLVSPRDTASFAQKLDWAVSDSREMELLHKWLQAQASRYDVATIGHELLKLYES